MMKRRALLLAMLGAAAPAGRAQPSGKAWRVGYLSLARIDMDKSWVGSFREGLRDLGYIEGKNLFLEQRHAQGNPELMPELAADLARNKVDVLVVYGAWLAPKKLPADVPIVFTVAADPVGAGLVTNLARPGGNITGFSDTHADLVPKRLELLKQVAPKASRVAVFLYPNPTSYRQLKIAQAAAPAQGMTVIPVEIKGPEAEDFERGVVALEKHPAHAALMIAEPTLSAHRRRITAIAIKHRMPAIGTVRLWAEAGLLLAYGTNFNELWRRAAGHVDKILKGAKAGDLPVEQPTKFELVINQRTAKAIGLAVPRALLLRADYVIE